jgi:DNA-binding transcriptional LysR family regulator
MRFTLKQLRYFDAALRVGSIARAADEMNISQSSITAAIDLIEQSIGTDLFRRIPAKGIVPTRTGTAVGERIAAFLEQARVFESDVMSLAGDPTGTLRLACYAPAAPYVLPPLLRRIAENYPDIRIDLMEGDLGSINAMLQNGTVDVALTYRRVLAPVLAFTPLFRARPWALLPMNSPLVNRRSVTIRDLADQPMIALELAGAMDYFRGLFAAEGLAPRIVHSTKSSSVLRGLVAAQFGYSILNICGPNDREGRSGFTALPIAGDVDAPLFGVACAAAHQRSAIVGAVIRISEEISAEGRMNHLLMEPESV